MSETPDSLVLNLLRAIRSDIAEVKADLTEVKERLGIMGAQYASLSRRVDRIGGDMQRVSNAVLT